MIVNGPSLLAAAPLSPMIDHKVREHGVSYGLSEAGYDIRIKQDVLFVPEGHYYANATLGTVPADTDLVRIDGITHDGDFTIASAIERFHLPPNLVGIVHDKSTWARHGLSVFNTVIEPGWEGFLTLELVYHGRKPLHIPAGAGIAQVIFHQTTNPMNYTGKYQHQPDEPVAPILK